MTERAETKDRLILIVDDDRSVLQLFELALSREGFPVETAASGAEALEKIESRAPHLVLLDLMIPDYGGCEILQMIRQKGTAAVPKVIVITGRFNDQALKDSICAQSHVVGYLEKPVRPSELASAVHRTLGTCPPVAPAW